MNSNKFRGYPTPHCPSGEKYTTTTIEGVHWVYEYGPKYQCINSVQQRVHEYKNKRWRI